MQHRTIQLRTEIRTALIDYIQAVRYEHLADPTTPADLAALRQAHEQHSQELSCQAHPTLATPLQSVLHELHRLHDAQEHERATLLNRARSEARRMRKTLSELHSRYASCHTPRIDQT